jgi:hypothetical protein
LATRICPLCRVAYEAEQRYMRWFLLENYYSPPALVALERSRFCPRHAALLAQGDNEQLTGTFQFLAQAEQALLARFRKNLRRERRSLLAGQRHLPEEIQSLLQTDGCPACAALATAVAVAARELVEFLADSAGRAAYQAHAEGLCRSHLWHTLQHSPTETAEWLAVEAARRMAALQEDIELYFHRLDYRFQHEPKGEEQIAWRRALRYFWGAADLDGVALEPSDTRQQG